MTKEQVDKVLKSYKGYDVEMKRSVCRAAFEFNPQWIKHGPPAEPYFILARQCGYVIPQQWKDMYSDLVIKPATLT